MTQKVTHCEGANDREKKRMGREGEDGRMVPREKGGRWEAEARTVAGLR
jgi:hypothetical protein